MTTVLVTGGTGFVGVNLVRDLAAAGYDVVSVDVGAPDGLTRGFLDPWASRVTWVTGDVCDAEVWRAVAVRDIELVVHAAAYTPYGEEEHEHLRRAMDINVGGLLEVLQFARATGVRRLLGVSTIGVYSEEYFTEPTGHVRLREDEPVDPHHVYGISKLTGEGLLRRARQLYGLETASLRLAQSWGPMERLTPYHSRMSIPYYWARQAAAGGAIEASPSGTGITEGRRLNQDHVYAPDAAAAVRALLEAPRLSHDVYNVSAGEPVFVDDMVAALREAVPEAGLATVESDSAAVSPGVTFDTARLVHDTAFAPAYDLAAALGHCVAWRREVGFLTD